jgi:cellobiose-specific phosphotransferase system component IIB
LARIQVQQLLKHGVHVDVILIGHQVAEFLEHLVTAVTGQNVVQVVQVKVAVAW